MQNARSLVTFAALATLVAGCTSGEDVVAVQGAKQLTDSGPFIHPTGVPLCVPGTYQGCIRSDSEAGAQAFNWAAISFALVPTATTGELSATLKQPAEVLGVTDTGALFRAALGSDGCQGGQMTVRMTNGVYAITLTSLINFTGTIHGTYYPDDDLTLGGGRFEGTWHADATGLPLKFSGNWSANWVSANTDAGVDRLPDGGVSRSAGCPSLH
jgi:hypothetical protein